VQFISSGSVCRRAFWVVCMLTISISADAAVPSGVSFLSDFAADPRQGKWGYLQVMNLDRLTASDITNHRKVAAKVDVRSGDNPMSCCVGTERAEVAHMKSVDSNLLFYETADSGTQYFAVSYKFPADFKSLAPGTWKGFQIILQLHGADALSAPPAFALDVMSSRFAVRTNAGDLVDGNRYVTHEFFDGSLNLGNWTDFMIRIKFATDATGSVTVWRRNETETRFRQVMQADGIPTLQYNSGRKNVHGRHYWKQGLYRSKTSVPNTFWMGPMARATSFAAAERAAFNTKSGMPK
jgi:hypothetical protein